jgi:hypothetical protein
MYIFYINIQNYLDIGIDGAVTCLTHREVGGTPDSRTTLGVEGWECNCHGLWRALPQEDRFGVSRSQIVPWLSSCPR